MKSRFVHRFWEVVPGLASWGTLIILTILSWKSPAWVAIFIVLYDLFWLIKSLYLLVYLQIALKKMHENLKVNWQEKLHELGGWSGVHHLILVPMYHESYDVVRASVLSFLETRYPRENLFLVVGIEERAGDVDYDVAKRIQEEFGGSFRRLLITTHPSGLPGEHPGKGSNETWMAREAIREIIDPLGIPYTDVLVSIFDADTRPARDYFSILTYKFLTAPNPQRSSYQPIPIFMNNIRSVSVFARLNAFSASFWQFMQQARPEQLVTFSSHSMPLKALVDVGFWSTDIVSEDSRIFFQCLDRYDGDWRTVPLLYPVSMDAVIGKNTFDSLRNLYKQQRRWAWGIENIPFVAERFFSNSKMRLRTKLFWMFTGLEGFWSWATSSFVIFLFGFLPNAIGGSDFHGTIVSYNLPQVTGAIVNISSIGIIVSAIASILLLVPDLRHEKFRWYYYGWYAVQWAIIPFTFIVFSAIPALEAQTRMILSGRFRLGFWVTPKSGTPSK